MPPPAAPPPAAAAAATSTPVRYADVVQLLLGLSRSLPPNNAHDFSTGTGPRTASPSLLTVPSPCAGSALHLGPSRSHLSLLSADPSDYADYLVAGDTPMTLSLADLLADSSVAALLSDKVRKADSVLLLREHHLAADQPASANPRIIVSFFHEDDGHDLSPGDAEREANAKQAHDPVRNVHFDLNANILVDDTGLELSLIDLTSQPTVAAMTKPGITAFLLRNHPLLAAQANHASYQSNERVDRDAIKSPRLGMLIRILGNEPDQLGVAHVDYPRELVFGSDNEEEEDNQDQGDESSGSPPDYLASPGNSYNASTSDTSTLGDPYPPSPRSTDLDTPPNPLDQSSDTAPDPSLRSSTTSIQHNPDNSPIAHSMPSLPLAAVRMRPTILAAPANTPNHSMLLHPPHGSVYLAAPHAHHPTHGVAFGPSPSQVAFPVPVNSPAESVAASQYYLVANPPPVNTPAGSVYQLAGHGAPWVAHAPPATHAYLAVGPHGAAARYASTATPLNTPMPSMTRLDAGTGAWTMLGGHPMSAHAHSTVLLAPHATPMPSTMSLTTGDLPAGAVPANTPMPSMGNLATASAPYLTHVPSAAHLAAGAVPFNTPMPSMAHLAATPAHARNVPQNTPTSSTADLRARSPRGPASRLMPGGLRAPFPTPLQSCAVLAETQEEEEEEVCAPENTPAPSVAHLAASGSATTTARAPHNTPMPSMAHLAASTGPYYGTHPGAGTGPGIAPHITPMPSMAHLAATAVPDNTPAPSMYQLASGATRAPNNTPAPSMAALASGSRPAAGDLNATTAMPSAPPMATTPAPPVAANVSTAAVPPDHVSWVPAPAATSAPHAASHVMDTPQGATWPTAHMPIPPPQQQPTVAALVHNLTTHLQAIPTASAASLAIQLETSRRMHELHVAALQAAADRDAYRHVLEHTVEALRGMELASAAPPVAAPTMAHGAAGHDVTSGPWIWAVPVLGHGVVPGATVPAGTTPASSPTTPTGPAAASTAPAPVGGAKSATVAAATATTTTVVNGVKVTRRTAGAASASKRSAKPATGGAVPVEQGAGVAVTRAAGAGLRP
ncbi:hypothetical protein AMAG_02017 [Allomyces macrogynus ATCC 38327]|uniref:Uncharacterized protein n=1 Tax=Allomyces macrogynus (strain ATCC 38327) TaxID=578462 RepID=A0A0L0S0T3_ALLM3|nr:hypothetical protein AMAG_02017 [Allomyces macrogynus ATCC 38327]|eukprot:KNE56183.1 hypothetical protein AMAG_02017 [Allomyces macrogynus ATCC 38327]